LSAVGKKRWLGVLRGVGVADGEGVGLPGGGV
jgi:hypothetical protein